MKNRLVTVVCVVAAIGLVGAFAFARNTYTSPDGQVLAPFEFRREAAPTPEAAAQSLFLGVATASPRDFVQHLLLGVCCNEINVLQDFAESMHATKFKTGAESYAVYDLPVGKNGDGGLKNDTIRIVASGVFPNDEKVAAVISGEAYHSYCGEEFRFVDVAADGSDGREYRSRVVVAAIKDRWYAIPRCRSSQPFYDIADAMPVTKPTAEQAK